MPSGNSRNNKKNNKRKGNTGKRRSRKPKTGLKPEEGYEYGSFSFEEYDADAPFGGLTDGEDYQNPFRRGEAASTQQPEQPEQPEQKKSNICATGIQ